MPTRLTINTPEIIKNIPKIVNISGIWLNFTIPTKIVAIIHSPANEAYVTPTGIVFITIDKVYIHPTIKIAVRIVGINYVNPCAVFA